MEREIPSPYIHRLNKEIVIRELKERMENPFINLNNLKRFLAELLSLTNKNLDTKTDEKITQLKKELTEQIKETVKTLNSVIDQKATITQLQTEIQKLTEVIRTEKETIIKEIKGNDSVPEVINSIEKIASSIHNDPHFYETVMNKIDQSVSTINTQIRADMKNHIDNVTDAHDVENRLSRLKDEVKLYTDTKISDVVASAPQILDTLKELADALGNDPNFSTTIMSRIGEKLDKSEVVADPTPNKVLRMDADGKFPVTSIRTDESHETVTKEEKEKWNNIVQIVNNIVSGGEIPKGDGTKPGLSTNDFTNEYKTKLDNIEAGANRYVHPANHPATMISQDENNRFVTDTEKNYWNNKQDRVGLATQTANGLMSATDKRRLDTMDPSATKVNVINNLTTTATGSALDAVQGKILNDTKANVNHSHTKADIGLSRVDNTPDGEKSVNIASRVFKRIGAENANLAWYEFDRSGVSFRTQDFNAGNQRFTSAWVVKSPDGAGIPCRLIQFRNNNWEDVLRVLTFLDENGHTHFPGNINVNGGTVNASRLAGTADNANRVYGMDFNTLAGNVRNYININNLKNEIKNEIRNEVIQGTKQQLDVNWLMDLMKQIPTI